MKKFQLATAGVMAACAMMSALPALAQMNQGNLGANELLPQNIGQTAGLSTGDVRLTAARIIRVAMSLLGIVAVVIVLIGGFKWMTAGGNDDQVGEAKKWIFSGIIGIAIILSAYAITSFVITNLVTATTTQ
jgi:hypothetical protein